MELFFIRAAKNFLGLGWAIKFSGLTDRYPTVEYVCPTCGNQNVWQSGLEGFHGKAPMPARCFKNGVECVTVPYPAHLDSYAKHLHAKAILDNKREPKSPFIDEWDRVPSEYPCDIQPPKELW